jgi:fructosamine-3-kinase
MQWDNIATDISRSTAHEFRLKAVESIGGGCINSAYRLVGQSHSFFVKLNRADKLDMFEAEAEGLQELIAANAIRVPQPICVGSDDDRAWLVMEYFEPGAGNGVSAEVFGRQLARMHRVTAPEFGWQRDNTIGSTPQINTRSHDWLLFWHDYRLGFQLWLAGRHGASHKLIQKGEALQAQMGGLFDGYRPEASILHGDLWSGNYAITREGEPVIFDPAVYYGDRETDLAMTELFGGFPARFYAAYNEVWPLDSGYEVRKNFYNLYHILNHFNLFGGGYAGQAERMIDQLLAELG